MQQDHVSYCSQLRRPGLLEENGRAQPLEPAEDMLSGYLIALERKQKLK